MPDVYDDYINSLQNAPATPQEDQPGYFRRALSGLSSILGAGQGGESWLIKQAAQNYGGLNIGDDPRNIADITAESLVPEENQVDDIIINPYARTLARFGVREGTRFLTDPLTFLLGGAGKVAEGGAAGLAALEAAKAGGVATPEVLAAAAKAASEGQTAANVGKWAARAFLPGAAEGVVEGVPAAYDNYKKEGFTPRTFESMLQAGLGGLMLAGIGPHAFHDSTLKARVAPGMEGRFPVEEPVPEPVPPPEAPNVWTGGPVEPDAFPRPMSAGDYRTDFTPDVAEDMNQQAPPLDQAPDVFNPPAPVAPPVWDGESFPVPQTSIEPESTTMISPAEAQGIAGGPPPAVAEPQFGQALQDEVALDRAPASAPVIESPKRGRPKLDQEPIDFTSLPIEEQHARVMAELQANPDMSIEDILGKLKMPTPAAEAAGRVLQSIEPADGLPKSGYGRGRSFELRDAPRQLTQEVPAREAPTASEPAPVEATAPAPAPTYPHDAVLAALRETVNSTDPLEIIAAVRRAQGTHFESPGFAADNDPAGQATVQRDRAAMRGAQEGIVQAGAPPLLKRGVAGLNPDFVAWREKLGEANVEPTPPVAAEPVPPTEPTVPPAEQRTPAQADVRAGVEQFKEDHPDATREELVGEIKRLRTELTTDSLTGLKNKRGWEDLGRDMVPGEDHAVVVDLKKFKPINDQFGHGAGDLALKKAGEIFKRHFGDQASRFGGDEFGAILKGRRTPEQLEALRQAFVDELQATTIKLKNPETSEMVDVRPLDAHVGFGDTIEEADQATNVAAEPSRKGGRGDVEVQGAAEGAAAGGAVHEGVAGTERGTAAVPEGGVGGGGREPDLGGGAGAGDKTVESAGEPPAAAKQEGPVPAPGRPAGKGGRKRGKRNPEPAVEARPAPAPEPAAAPAREGSAAPAGRAAERAPVPAAPAREAAGERPAAQPPKTEPAPAEAAEAAGGKPQEGEPPPAPTVKKGEKPSAQILGELRREAAPIKRELDAIDKQIEEAESSRVRKPETVESRQKLIDSLHKKREKIQSRFDDVDVKIQRERAKVDKENSYDTQESLNAKAKAATKSDSTGHMSLEEIRAEAKRRGEEPPPKPKAEGSGIQASDTEAADWIDSADSTATPIGDSNHQVVEVREGQSSPATREKMAQSPHVKRISSRLWRVHQILQQVIRSLDFRVDGKPVKPVNSIFRGLVIDDGLYGVRLDLGGETGYIYHSILTEFEHAVFNSRGDGANLGRIFAERLFHTAIHEQAHSVFGHKNKALFQQYMETIARKLQSGEAGEKLIRSLQAAIEADDMGLVKDLHDLSAETRRYREGRKLESVPENSRRAAGGGAAPEAGESRGRAAASEVAQPRGARLEEGVQGSGEEKAEGVGGAAAGRDSGSEREANLSRFMAGSHVVDESGKPLIVYHGSSNRFTEFDPNKAGTKTDSGYLGRGFYFGDREHGGMYANMSLEAARKNSGISADHEWTGSPHIPIGEKSTLYPSYLSLKKPLTLWERRNPEFPTRLQDRLDHIREVLGLPKDATSAQVTATAKAKGHDGVIFHYADINSEYTTEPTYRNGRKEYVAFDPNQIKSAIGNEGTFDPNNPRIDKSTSTPGRGGRAKEGVPFFITEAMRAELKSHNFTDKQIDAMRPATAHELLDDLRSGGGERDTETDRTAPDGARPTGGKSISPLDDGRSLGQPPRVEAKVEEYKHVLSELDPEQKKLFPQLLRRLYREAPRTWLSLDKKIQAKLADILTDKGKLDTFLTNMRRGATGPEGDVNQQVMDALVETHKQAMLAAQERLKAAQESGEGLGQATLDNLTLALDEAKLRFTTSAGADVQGATLLGRALAARGRIMKALEGIGAPANDPRLFIKNLLKHIDGMTNERAEELYNLAQKSPEKLTDALINASSPTVWDKFFEVWKNGLVSGLPTQGANISGNIVEIAPRLAETLMSAGLDYVIPGVKGSRLAGEAGAELRGSRMGAVGALPALMKDLGAILKLKPEDLGADTFQMEHAPAISGKAGRFVRIPFRLLGAFDNWFKEIGKSAETHKLAWREAKGNRGIYEELVKNPTPEIIAAAKQSMLERVYQDPNKFADVLVQARSLHPMLNFIIPFIKTPLNIAHLTLQRSPLGFAEAFKELGKYNEAVKSARLKGEPLLAEHQAKMRGIVLDKFARPLLGTAILTAAYEMTKAGNLTGSGPADPKLNKQLQDTGWRPYSMVVDGKDGKVYIPFNRFEPLSSILGFGADMAEAKDEKTVGSIAEKITGSAIQNIFNKTFALGATEFANAVANPTRYAQQYLTSLAGTAIPNIVAKGAQAIDPVYRDTTPEKKGLAGFGERIENTLKSRIPGLSQTLPEQTTALGKPRGRDSALDEPLAGLSRFLLPVQATREKSDPLYDVEREMTRIGIAPKPNREMTLHGGKTIRLNDAEFAMVQDAYEQAAKKAAKVIKSSGWSRLPDTDEEVLAEGGESKESVLNSIYSGAKRAARQRIYNDPRFRTRALRVQRGLDAQE